MRQSVLIIMLMILIIIVCFENIDISMESEALKKEKQALEDLTETQNSMISDLEENCKDLYIEIERLRYE